MAGIDQNVAAEVRRCQVCGEKSNGYHYSVLSCEGCKAFFKRSVMKMRENASERVYRPCKNGDQCTIDIYRRRMCKSCRYNKCIRAGMRPEYVSTSRGTSSEELPTSVIAPPSSTPSTPNTLSFLDKCAVQLLVTLLDKYQSTKEEADNLFPQSGELGSSNSMPCEGILTLAQLAVKNVVLFANDLPGFCEISIEDRIQILKSCSIELMILDGWRKYIPEEDCVMFANGSPCTRTDYVKAGIMRSADPLFDFWRNLSILKLDDCENALMSAIIIFSRRPELGQLCPEFLEQMHENYFQLLVRYTEFRCSQPGEEVGTSTVRLAKLMAALTELRGLGLLNESDCYDLVFSGKEIPDLLLEAYDPKIQQFAKFCKDLGRQNEQ